MIDTKKRAVTILLHNEEGDILAVSRKNDSNDFGLPGGKVDEGETDEQAIIREVKEETGLTINNIVPYFVREDDEYLCTTFIGNYVGEIITSEKGKVIWTNFETIKKGSFGIYNQQLEEYFDVNNKYKHGDILINPDTSEGFLVMYEANGPGVPGYFISAFCSSSGHAYIKKTALDNVRMHLVSSERGGFVLTAEYLEKMGIKDLDPYSAQYYACASHFDANQYYTHSKSPLVEVLYSYHLKRVVDVGRRFKHEVPDEDWDYVEGGLWNHDCVEDARKTFNDASHAIGEKSALIAFALTNSDGKTRDERADAKYYAKIRNTKHATFAKLCDRIANIEHGIKTGSSMAKKYKKEHQHFKQELYVAGQYESMWNHIDVLFQFGTSVSA